MNLGRLSGNLLTNKIRNGRFFLNSERFNWTPAERHRLQRAVEEMRHQLPTGSLDIDWFALANQHFPGHDPLELSLEYEINPPSNMDLTSEVKSSFQHGEKKQKSSYKRLSLSRSWTEDENRRLLRFYFLNEHKNESKMESEFNRPYFLCSNQLSELINGSSVKQSRGKSAILNSTGRALSIIARHQFKVMGPQWDTIGQLLNQSSTAARLIVGKSTDIWFEHPSGRSSLSPRHGKLWNENDIALLMDAVDQQMLKWRTVRPELRHQDLVNRIDWTLIGQVVGRGPIQCEERYIQIISKGHVKLGPYSEKEDQVLLKNWKQHQGDYSSYQLSSRRDPNSIRKRIMKLLVMIMTRETRTYEMAASLGITDADVQSFCDKNSSAKKQLQSFLSTKPPTKKNES